MGGGQYLVHEVAWVPKDIPCGQLGFHVQVQHQRGEEQARVLKETSWD